MTIFKCDRCGKTYAPIIISSNVERTRVLWLGDRRIDDTGCTRRERLDLCSDCFTALNVFLENRGGDTNDQD